MQKLSTTDDRASYNSESMILRVILILAMIVQPSGAVCCALCQAGPMKCGGDPGAACACCQPAEKEADSCCSPAEPEPEPASCCSSHKPEPLSCCGDDEESSDPCDNPSQDDVAATDVASTPNDAPCGEPGRCCEPAPRQPMPVPTSPVRVPQLTVSELFCVAATLQMSAGSGLHVALPLPLVQGFSGQHHHSIQSALCVWLN